MSSVTTVSLNGRQIKNLGSQSFNCYNVSVNSFTIEAGDFVAACVYDPAGGTRQLDVIGRNVAGYLMRTEEDDVSDCSESSLPTNVLNSRLSNRTSRILHLYATITGRYNKLSIC